MCVKVSIELFKICGYFVGVYDNDDEEPQTKKANPTDRWDMTNQSQSLGEDGVRSQTLDHHVSKSLTSLIFK